MRPRPGREPTYDRAARDRVIALTLEPPPVGTTHWSTRAMAARTGISISTIARIWAEANLKPHRVETFKFSTDPELVTKVRDVVGLYLAPPERAIVLSVDELVEHSRAPTDLLAWSLRRSGTPVGPLKEA